MKILDKISELLTAKSSVQMVADDPVMAAEIMLLVRVMFADGKLSGDELDHFKKVCLEVFDIPESDVPEVIRFLRDYGYETSGEQAASSFQHMPLERRKLLMSHLMSMAAADSILHEREADLLTRVAKVLGFTRADMEAGFGRV